MKNAVQLKIILLAIGLMLMWFIGAASSYAAEEASPRLEETKAFTHTPVPNVTLPVPDKQEHREYLGVAEGESFSINDIKAQVVLIEVFMMSCPHCQKEAPNVNSLYNKLRSDPGLDNSIKLIGVGTGNTPLEVDLFRKKYEIVFPLFSDKDFSIARDLDVRATPTFIAAKIRPGSDPERFYFASGPLGDVHEFLKKIIAQAGLSKEL